MKSKIVGIMAYDWVYIYIYIYIILVCSLMSFTLDNKKEKDIYNSIVKRRGHNWIYINGTKCHVQIKTHEMENTPGCFNNFFFNLIGHLSQQLISTFKVQICMDRKTVQGKKF